MQYWVVKGSTERNDWSVMLRPQEKPERWVTRRPPKKWREGDRVFFWESAPGVRIIGLGTLTKIENANADGDTFFFIRADTTELASPLGIAELRAERRLSAATFLKSGAAGTVYALEDYEVRRLIQLVHKANATVQEVTADWGLSVGLDLASNAPERKLTDRCVYTIIAPEKLIAASHGADPSERLHEGKRWATAAAMLADAKKAGEELPIVFADSRECVKLISWAVLTEITLNGNETDFRIANLAPLKGRTQQDLIVESTAERIPVGHIRPYLICRTPGFIG